MVLVGCVVREAGDCGRREVLLGTQCGRFNMCQAGERNTTRLKASRPPPNEDLLLEGLKGGGVKG